MNEEISPDAQFGQDASTAGFTVSLDCGTVRATMETDDAMWMLARTQDGCLLKVHWKEPIKFCRQEGTAPVESVARAIHEIIRKEGIHSGNLALESDRY